MWKAWKNINIRNEALRKLATHFPCFAVFQRKPIPRKSISQLASFNGTENDILTHLTKLSQSHVSTTSSLLSRTNSRNYRSQNQSMRSTLSNSSNELELKERIVHPVNV